MRNVRNHSGIFKGKIREGGQYGVLGVIVLRAAEVPARWAVENAIWRLYPPVGPSASMTSPAKKRPGHSLDSIVFRSISSVETPPRVMVASAIGAVDSMERGSCLSIFTSSVRCFFWSRPASVGEALS